MATNIRESIRERLDPVIEEIVSKEINERGSYSREQGGRRQERSFESLLPILLPTLMGRHEEKENRTESLLPILLISMMSRHEEKENRMESLLPILMNSVKGRHEERESHSESLLPILVAALSAR